MTKKPIIDIDVNSGAFNEFIKSFDDYQKKLEGMPDAWKAMNQRVGEFQKLQMAAGVSAEASLAAAMKMEGALKNVGHEQHSNAVAANRSASAFKSMALDTVKMGKGILSITSHLMKWGGLVGALGLGAGLFGLDRLADSAMNQQRGARGMNVSIGQAASMKVNMSRFLSSPDQAMNTVANAQQNYSQWGNFAALGLNPAEVAQRGTFGATLQVAEAARLAWKTYHNAAMPQVQAAERLGFSISDMRRMAKEKNFGAAISRTRSDVGSLGLSGGVASAWSRFSIQLSRAGRQIENTLIGGLAPLAPELTKVSAAINKDLIALLHSPELKKAIAGFAGWIGGAGKDLNQFGKFLAGEKFQSDLKTFATAISQLASETVNALRFFHLIPQATPSFDKLKKAAAQKAHPTIAGNLLHREQIAVRRAAGDYNPLHLHELNKKYAAQFGVPTAIADRLTMDESGYGKHMMSAAGAVGPDQLMGPTAGVLGVQHRANARENIRGGVQYLSAMYQRYHSWSKAVAAYNMGPGALDKDIAAHGKKWLHYAPTQTQTEVSNVIGANASKVSDAVEKMLRMARQKQAQSHKYLTITNATAAHVAVSANAMAGALSVPGS